MNRAIRFAAGVICLFAGMLAAPMAMAQITYTLPYVLPDGGARESFIRIVNNSFDAASVQITAIDDTGESFGPVTLSLESNQTVNFRSSDLEQGNASKGLPVGVGDGEGNWRISFDSTLDFTALAYIRTSDGFVTSMHDVVPVTSRNHRVRFFNPGSNPRQVSLLRIVNPGEARAEVLIRDTRDDAGEDAPGGNVTMIIPAGESRMLTAQDLEAGADGFTGSFGDGTGKWRFTVTSNVDIHVMSLLQTPTGHLANLSTSPSEDAPETFPEDAEPLVLEGSPVTGMTATITGQIDPQEDETYYTTMIDEDGIIEFTVNGDVEMT